MAGTGTRPSHWQTGKLTKFISRPFLAPSAYIMRHEHLLPACFHSMPSLISAMLRPPCLSQEQPEVDTASCLHPCAIALRKARLHSSVRRGLFYLQGRYGKRAGFEICVVIIIPVAEERNVWDCGSKDIAKQPFSVLLQRAHLRSL